MSWERSDRLMIKSDFRSQAVMQFGPGLLPTFLYYFTGTAVILSFVTLKALHIGIDTGIPQEVGAIGGLLAGVLGSYFNRTLSFSVPIQGKKKFRNQLETILSQMGYQQTGEEEGVLIFERSASSGFFSGRVFVQIEGDMMTIASRASTVRRIKKAIEA